MNVETNSHKLSTEIVLKQNKKNSMYRLYRSRTNAANIQTGANCDETIY